MRVITKNEVKEPFRALLGELVYELIGTSTETGGAKLHSLAHVVIPQAQQDEFMQQFLTAFRKAEWSKHKSGDDWPPK